MSKAANARRATAPVETTAATRNPRAAGWIARIALVALVFIAFSPALSADFVSWDDEQNITSNHSFRGLSAKHLAWMFTTNWMGPYQPLSWLTLAIDHAAHGLSGPTDFPEAPRYHATNVAIHALAALFFFAFARRLFAFVAPSAARANPERILFAAFVASACFAIHPLRAESVAWVTERRDVLCGAFYAATGCAWLRFAGGSAVPMLARRSMILVVVTSTVALALLLGALDLSAREALALTKFGALQLAGAFVALAIAAHACGSRWYAVALATFLCALLSKGLAMSLPALLLLLDLWPLRRLGGDSARAKLAALGRLLVEKLPFFVLAIVCARLAMWGQSSNPGTLASWKDHTLSERALQAAYGLVFYPLKTLLPLGLSPIYGLPQEIRITDARFALSLLAAFASFATCVALWRKRPAVGVAWACFAIAIAPVLGFTQAGPQITADRYSYFSCMPFALLAGAALVAWNPTSLRIGALVLIATLTALCARQTRFWSNSTALWEHASSIDPTLPMTHLNLGHDRVRQAQRAGSNERREALLHEALSIFVDGSENAQHPLLFAGQALVHQQLWEIDPARRAGEAELALKLAREAFEFAEQRGELTPDYHLNLGSALFNAKQIDAAIAELAIYVAARPDGFFGRFNLGFALARARRHPEALEHLERAVELEPTFVAAWGTLAIEREALGQREAAIAAYERVLELAPQHPTANARLRELQGP